MQLSTTRTFRTINFWDSTEGRKLLFIPLDTRVLDCRSSKQWRVEPPWSQLTPGQPRRLWLMPLSLLNLGTNRDWPMLCIAL